MTDQQHPIVPSEESVLFLRLAAPPYAMLDAGVTRERNLITAAWSAGADAELEACKQFIRDQDWFAWPEPRLTQLHNSRRPKPPTKTDQALTDLEQLLDVAKSSGVFNPPDNIRRCLERLKKLEESTND